MLHVLLVDDEVISSLALRSFLERKGFRVSMAARGADAITIFDKDPAEVAVVDWRMPGMNGGELVTHLRARRPSLPVVFVTGYSPEVEPFAAALPTPPLVLDKPVDPQAVVESIRSLLSGGFA
ncbi:MAG TPA: response regulator [Azospirillaceae bacterium]|nr:response regulator [Azospirillaceae bacterium]